MPPRTSQRSARDVSARTRRKSPSKKQRSPGPGAGEGTRSNAPPSPTARFLAAAAAAILALVDALERASGRAPTRRRILSALRGNAPLTELEHHRGHCPAFGVFSGLPVVWVEARLDELLEEGLLEPASSEGGSPALGLRISSAAAAILEEREASRQVTLLGVSGRPPPALSSAQRRVLEKLAALRARIGREEGRPAFSILPNAAVEDIVRRRPKDLAELAAAVGMGVERVRKYGRRILRAMK